VRAKRMGVKLLYLLQLHLQSFDTLRCHSPGTAQGAGSKPQDAYVALGVTKKGGEDAGSSGGGSNAGLIVGIVLGILAVALVAFLIFYIPKRRKEAESKSALRKKATKKRAKK